ncbi:low-complexity protein [Nostoc sp. 'Peltigera membranacea cyanobiont' 213]|uniref:pentapeptide repeat-containing protein n=1 Tax=unclassified Nostoc TaxID=2593658 RepID=UPI000B95BCB3|nr:MULTISPECIES: pentapeptide repeat-containing protein [unclassified Nostoc]AVH65416.1 pentapeptide repeat-containing protein [Nostoc sp. 'Peltigera membranacea cyanobiont' N6]OYD87079.1 low-complexity protein [Nostoc sp. 'Peltigera membranacea cyanobiont' 213]OYE00277.1 low-complexity protein [Nostoc sp. 'Peltigera membranacea cyanobiont' 232]
MPEVNSQQPINTAATLVESYAAGKRDFSKAELGNADLQAINLKGSDFSYADFSEANLSGANLRGTDLSFADLGQANLRDADLRGALLMSANLRQADLKGAKLEKADYDRSTHFPQDFDPIKVGMQIKFED